MDNKRRIYLTSSDKTAFLKYAMDFINKDYYTYKINKKDISNLFERYTKHNCYINFANGTIYLLNEFYGQTNSICINGNIINDKQEILKYEWNEYLKDEQGYIQDVLYLSIFCDIMRIIRAGIGLNNNEYDLKIYNKYCSR